MKTKAAILYKLNSPLIIDEVEIPALNRGQILVKMQSGGICRSQLNQIKGVGGEDKYLPHLLGHEGAGEVSEIGSGVTKVKKGDRVVLTWIKGKGLEAGPVKFGHKNTIINAGSITTFSNYTIVSENRLVKIEKDIPAKIAAILGCAVATGAGIVFNTIKLDKNNTIAVFGAGGVGGSCILAAVYKKCKRIIAVDISGEKLSFARELGATDTVNGLLNNREDQILQIVPKGADFAIDATGIKQAMETAFNVINNSGTLVIAGNLARDEKICINPFDLIKGKKIIGSWGGETDPEADIPKYARLYRWGKLKLDKLITRIYKFEDINKAFFDFENNKTIGKIIIDFC